MIPRCCRHGRAGSYAATAQFVEAVVPVLPLEIVDVPVRT